MAEVIEASKAAGVKDVRIIASTKKMVEEMRFLKYILPHLIETVTWLKDTFKFDGVTI